MTIKDVDELRSWVRKQMAADETKIRGAMYTSRQLDVAPPLQMIEMLSQLESDRERLDTMDDLGLREIGLLYADRDGYQDAWRP